MPQVHSTAVIDPSAELADDVVIGPWCIIGEGVKIGRGTRLFGRVTLEGPLVIGAKNIFYPQAAIGLPPQDRKFGPDVPSSGVVIGDSNIFREGVTVHRATGSTPTSVGSRNMLMVNSHLGHDVTLGDDCTLANGALVAGHVHVASSVTISGNAAVHQFCRLGRLSMISGNMGIVQDLPPFCTVYVSRRVGSLNLIGLRRAGLRNSIRPLTRAFDILYRGQHSTQRAVEMITSELGDDACCREIAEFCRLTRRGIGSYKRASDFAEIG
jgi:UDP-N-acetylglucosamine acyltransferase